MLGCQSDATVRKPGRTYRPTVGLEVNADPMNRSPSTATVPAVTVKSAEPCLPTIPDIPGRFLKTTAVLFRAGRGTLDVPMVLPATSRRTIDTTLATLLGLTIPTDVTQFVSSHGQATVSCSPFRAAAG